MRALATQPGAPPVEAELLNGLEVLMADLLGPVMQQRALLDQLLVPGLWPGLQVLLDVPGDLLIMGRDDLGAVLPVNLPEKAHRRCILGVAFTSQGHCMVTSMSPTVHTLKWL